MKFPRLFLSLIIAVLCFSGCSTVDLPKGTSRGYSSARFVKTSIETKSDEPEDSPFVNRAIQDAIANQFRIHGLTMGAENADLIVAYMLIRQTNAMTAMNANHFGYGRDSMAIMDEAHERGVIDNKRPDEFEVGAIVVDILDAKTNKLVYRNFTKRDMDRNLDNATRQIRINEAVAETLTPFFK